MAGPIIYDEEHNAAAELVSNALKQLSKLFSSYVTELESLSSDKIVLGKAGEALQAYAEQAAAVQSTIEAIGDTHKQACQQFLASVDTTDQIQL